MTEMLSVKGFCAAYGISKSFVYKLWREGRGPGYVKVGKRRLIPVAAADAWRASLELETEQSLKRAA